MKEDNKEFENLYKKAAENFPLKTDNADWQSVLSALEDEDKKTPFFINRKVLILGILLFLVTFLYINTLVNHKNNISNNIAEKKQSLNEEEIQLQNAKLKQAITDAVYKKIYDSINTKKYISNVDSEKQDAIAKKSIIQIDNTILANTKNINYHNIGLNASKLQKSKSINTTKGSLENISNNTEFAISKEEKDITVSHSKQSETQSTQTLQKDANKSLKGVYNNEIIQSDRLVNNIDSLAITAEKIDTLDKATIKSIAVDSLKKSNVATQKKSTNKFDKYFYAGALYAFDNSFEKKEKHKEKGEGSSISLLLGYRLSKKISIETGLSFQRKEYYTSANYFNKSILDATGDVDGIEAENSFMEIPLTLKFDWSNKKQHNMFTTIGLSSYFVNKERYEFEENQAGVINNKSIEFTTVTSNLFATCNFSFGYQYNFKKIGSIRVQPYINLPLKGLGKSQEYLVSKGINIGWIYNFNKK